MRRSGCRAMFVAIAFLLSACAGPQSALDPAGPESRGLATLFWIMLAAAGLIWLAVNATVFHASRAGPRRWSAAQIERFIFTAGVVFPAVALGALLTYGLTLLPAVNPSSPDLRVRVSGEQWWWRVTYETADGPVASANEIRLPAGQAVEFVLTCADVIHSFWIPSLGGKLDMIPGRTNRLTLKPERPGVYRGACAEYCGTSHALMAFTVIVMEPQAFADWLAKQGKPVAETGDERGRRLFLATGCGGCHTVRGTPADGAVGPDLTHIGSRRTLGAGTLANTPENMVRWIAATRDVKPNALMPSFHMLPHTEIAAIADWLSGLE